MASSRIVRLPKQSKLDNSAALSNEPIVQRFIELGKGGYFGHWNENRASRDIFRLTGTSDVVCVVNHGKVLVRTVAADRRHDSNVPNRFVRIARKVDQHADVYLVTFQRNEYEFLVQAGACEEEDILGRRTDEGHLEKCAKVIPRSTANAENTCGNNAAWKNTEK